MSNYDKVRISNEKTKSSTTSLITVKKFAVFATLLCCFFLTGLLIGFYAFFKRLDKEQSPAVTRIEENDAFDYDLDTESLKQIRKYELYEISKKTDNIPDFLLKPHLLNNQSIVEIKRRFNLSENEQISINKYFVNIPRYERNRKSTIKFYSDDELLSKEQLKGSTLFNLFNGTVKAKAVLIEGRTKLEDVNISSVKGAIVVTPLDTSSLDKATFFEAVGAKALLFYKEKSIKDCHQNQSHSIEKPFWWYQDASTPGYAATEEVYRVPPLKWTIPKIPIVIIQCQVILDILPYLQTPRALIGELDVTSTLSNTTLTNLVVSFQGHKEPDLSVFIGATRNNEIGTKRLVRILSSFSSVVNEHDWLPAFTVTFISWDAIGHGMSEFFEAYKSVRRETMVMYIDLDHLEADNGKDHLMTSLSLESFAKTTLEQASVNIKTKRMKNQKSCFPDGFPGLTFEEEIGIPFIKGFSSIEESDELELLRAIGSLLISASSVSPLQISLLKTMGEISRAIKDLVHRYPVVKDHIPALSSVLQRVRFSLVKFENSLKPDVALTSGKNKMVNRVKSTIENTLRLSLHRLNYLIKNPMSRFLQSNNSHVGSHVYAKIFRKFFESEINQCPDRSNSFTACILHEMSVILSKLHNVINALNFS